jgi:hypothetical protein
MAERKVCAYGAQVILRRGPGWQMPAERAALLGIDGGGDAVGLMNSLLCRRSHGKK